jgi:hypothetical protein
MLHKIFDFVNTKSRCGELVREFCFNLHMVLWSKHMLLRLDIVSVIEQSTKEKYTVNLIYSNPLQSRVPYFLYLGISEKFPKPE